MTGGAAPLYVVPLQGDKDTAKASRTIKPVHRNSAQLRGVRAQVVGAINHCTDGADVVLDIRSARNLVEVCDQAIRTEVGHEPSAAEIEAVRPFL